MALTTYGARLDARQLVTALEHVFLTNLKRHEQGRAATPVCIWGTHGMGKTATVKSFAQRHGWKFAYVAPAQFEEMDDLHGLPTLNEYSLALCADNPNEVPALARAARG